MTNRTTMVLHSDPSPQIGASGRNIQFFGGALGVFATLIDSNE